MYNGTIVEIDGTEFTKIIPFTEQKLMSMEGMDDQTFTVKKFLET